MGRRRGTEENLTLTRKLFFWILAASAAALMPVAANCQIAPEKAPSERTGPEYKYEAFVGWGYTSLNQVNQSNSGLQGVSLSVTRDWGKYFGATLEVGTMPGRSPKRIRKPRPSISTSRDRSSTLLFMSGRAFLFMD